MNTVTLPANRERQSGVELLKILGIFLIVISHVTQTLENDIPLMYLPFHEYYLGSLTDVTTNPLRLFMGGLLYGGVLGNNIFFFCSAWFLLDKEQGSNRKISHLLSDVWVVSALILCVFAFCLRGGLDRGLILRQFFPVILQNNWYVTTYLMFLPLYPALNGIISRLDQKSLLRATGFLMILLFFLRPAALFQWVVYYFMIAYMKRYLQDASSNVKWNVAVLLFSVAGIAVSIVAANMIGLRTASLAGLLPRLRQMYNPFVILTALSLLNVALHIPIKNGAVNYVSSKSLFVYLIHENQLIRTYLRPWIWQKLHMCGGGGYSHIILCIFAYSAVLFLCSFAASVFYVTVIRKSVWRVSDALFARIFRVWEKLETRLLSLR